MYKNKNIKRLILLIIFIALLVFGCISERYIDAYKSQYVKAKSLLKNESYEESIKKFNSLEKYKLSKIDKDEINMYIDKANKKLSLKEHYMRAERLLCNGEYLDALRYYFRNNDINSKYYKLSEKRIIDTFNLYLIDEIDKDNEKKTINDLKNLISDLENYDKEIFNLYEDDIDVIKETIDKIDKHGLDSIKPDNRFEENDFEVIEPDLGINQIKNKKTNLTQTINIDGEFSSYEDYYFYKINGNAEGKYELTINFKGHTDIIKGNLGEIQNILQRYKLPEKPQYGDIILINMKVNINGDEIHQNISTEYREIDKNKNKNN